MLRFETDGPNVLKIVCDDVGVVYTRHGAFIGGTSRMKRNYEFEDVFFGSDKDLATRIKRSISRAISGEHIRLTKCKLCGSSVTYYADNCKNVHIMKLKPNERITIQADYVLAYTEDCELNVRVFTQGILTGAGFVSTTLTGKGDNAYVALTSSGKTVKMSNINTDNAIVADPDSVVCWSGADPEVDTDFDARMLIGRASGESYSFLWRPEQPAVVVIQPFEGDVDSMVPDDGNIIEDVAEAFVE